MRLKLQSKLRPLPQPLLTCSYLSLEMCILTKYLASHHVSSFAQTLLPASLRRCLPLVWSRWSIELLSVLTKPCQCAEQNMEFMRPGTAFCIAGWQWNLRTMALSWKNVYILEKGSIFWIRDLFLMFTVFVHWIVTFNFKKILIGMLLLFTYESSNSFFDSSTTEQ